MDERMKVAANGGRRFARLPDAAQTGGAMLYRH
jgi:hypothetical protein